MHDLNVLALIKGGERFVYVYDDGSREAVIAAGLFPEIYYMHYEEVELAWRVIDQGGSIFHRPDLTAVHHANPIAKRSEIKVFYKPRNQVLLAARCMPFWRGLCYVVPRLVYGVIEGLRHGCLRDWIRAMRSATSVSRRCLVNRKPLVSRTWHRIAVMRRQSVRTSSSTATPNEVMANPALSE